MGKISCFVALALAAELCAGANTKEVASIDDVRCVAVGIKLAGMANSPQQTPGMMITMYYLGRLEARLSKIAIEKLIVDQIPKMSAADYENEAKRCGTILTEKGLQIRQIGNEVLHGGTRVE
jgi:hypothetical protein